MAKNNANKSKKKSLKQIPLTPAKQAEMALSFKQECNYKKAIEGYKKLVKECDDPQWPPLLAECYRLRAQQLADKGMFIEALANFDTVKQLTGYYPDVDTGAHWLSKSQDWNRIARFYQQHNDNPIVNQWLSPIVAWQALLNNSAVIEHLDKEGTLWQHCTISQQIINAWCEHKDQQVKALLQQLPFRSAYKDIAKTFKALLIIDTDLAKAEALLQSVNSQSIFYGFSQDLLAIYRFNLDDQQNLLHKLDIADPLATIKHWPNNQKLVWKNLQDFSQSTNPAASPKKALQLLKSCKTPALPAVVSQQLLAAIFYQGKFKDDDNRFAPLPSHERYRLLALQSSAKDCFHCKERDWLNFIEVWQQAHPADENNQTQSTVAAAYQHLADESGPQHPPSHIKYLTLSVNTLASETGYQQLIKINQRYPVEDFAQILSQAVTSFPDNIGFLKAAMHTADEQHNATQSMLLAKLVLGRDPVNQSARRVLINSYLTQASRQVRLQRPAEIAATLAQALALEPSGHQLSRYYLIQALRCWHFDKKQIEHWTDLALANLKSPLALRLGLLLNGKAIDLTTTAISRQLGSIGKTADINEISQLLSFAVYLQSSGFKLDKSVLKPFMPLIKKTLNQADSYQHILQCCHLLTDLQLYSLLESICKRHSLCFFEDVGMLTFYQVYGSVEGDPRRITEPMLFRLNSLYQRILDKTDKNQNQSQEQNLGEATNRDNLQIIESFIAKARGCQLVLDYDDYDDDDDDEDDFPFDSMGQFLDEAMSDPQTAKQIQKLFGGINPFDLLP
ncbi:MAG: hypothetical protein ACI8WB_004424 [Phenylobacterium sp.]|jgi:hypothetical protein